MSDADLTVSECTDIKLIVVASEKCVYSREYLRQNKKLRVEVS